MKLLLPFILIAVMVSSCCDPEMIGSYDLTQDQKDLIKYSEGDKITLSFNDEYDFDLDVTEAYTWDKHVNPFEESCSYYEVEERKAKLFSGYPNLDMEITVEALGEAFNPYAPGFTLRLNYKYFHTEDYYGEEPVIFQDTTVNGFSYEDVMVLYNYTDQENFSDSTAVYFENIVWSKTNGLELITFNNGDFYVLKK